MDRHPGEPAHGGEREKLPHLEDILHQRVVGQDEAVRRHPYCVVLFDEVEKAHPDVFNILLQVLDDGRITDSQGRTVDFKNTVIILTSNLGSQFLLDGIGPDGEIGPEAREQVDGLLKRSFRPEFLNRLDEIVFYKPLTKDNVTHIIDSAYDPVYGARPLCRYLQHTVETLISRKIIAGEVEQGDTLAVDCGRRAVYHCGLRRADGCGRKAAPSFEPFSPEPARRRPAHRSRCRR